MDYFVKNLCEKTVTLSHVSPNYAINIFYLIYPAILAGGLLLSPVVPESWQTFYFFSSRNLVNQIFAYKGNIVFTLLYFLVSIARIGGVPLRKQAPISLLPLPNTVEIDDEKKKLTKLRLISSQVVKFVLKNVILFINFFVIDHLFILTGGNCFIDGSVQRSITDAQQCSRKDGKWKGGFDISGHFCFLVSISLILFNELAIITQECQFRKAIKAISYLVLSVLFIWCCVLTVTSVFYHTLLEKVLGLLMGYLCPLVIYSRVLSRIVV